MKTILSILTIILLGSCVTSKNAPKKLGKIYKKFPIETAKFTRDSLPCITTDSVVTTTYEDSIIYVQCPDDYFTRDTAFVKGDTVFIKGKIVPVTVTTKTVYVEKKVEDSAKIKMVLKHLSDKEKESLEKDKLHAKELAKKDKLISEKDDKIANKNTWIKWLGGAAFIFALITALLAYLKFRR